MRNRTYFSIVFCSVFIMGLACNFSTSAESPTKVPTDNAKFPTVVPTYPLSDSGLCNSKYLPVVNDATKAYSVTLTKAGLTKSSTNYETILYYGGRNYFMVSTRLGSRVGYAVDDIWDCSNKGLTKSAFESGEFSTFFINAETGISARQTGDWCPGGITLPTDIRVNDSWTQQTDFEFTSSNLKGWNWFKWNILQKPLNVRTLPLPAGSGRFIYKYKAVGLEMIKVPAGTYNALRIDVTAEGYLDPSKDFSPLFENSSCAWSSSTIDQANPFMALTFEGSTWWVSDIGWVKKKGTLRNTQDVIESYEIELESPDVP